MADTIVKQGPWEIALSTQNPIALEWQLDRAAWFRMPDDEFGGCSNMSKAYPLSIFGKRIRSSEHLYQMMRFTHRPELQLEILMARTPMQSKRVSRQHDELTREDWHDIRVDVMRWVLRVKLFQNRMSFGKLLRATAPRPIVEWSRRDSFWGARPVDATRVRGQNVLGQLLTRLRADFLAESGFATEVPAPGFPNARFLGVQIGRLSKVNAVVPLVTAADLQDVGLRPGAAFGFVLKACLQRQGNGEVTNQSEALNLAQALYWEHTGQRKSCVVED